MSERNEILTIIMNLARDAQNYDLLIDEFIQQVYVQLDKLQELSKPDAKGGGE